MRPEGPSWSWQAGDGTKAWLEEGDRSSECKHAAKSTRWKPTGKQGSGEHRPSGAGPHGEQAGWGPVRRDAHSPVSLTSRHPAPK